MESKKSGDFNPIHHFTIQINALKQLAQSSEEAPIKRSKQIESMAVDILKQIQKHKEEILNQMRSGVVHPASRKVVEQLSHFTEELKKEILNSLTMRSTEMIEKDLQMIDDYQSWSLDTLDVEDEEMESLRDRLKKVTEEHLKALNKLKDLPSDMSLDTIGEWILHIQREREKNVDTLLHRIESVVREVKPFSIEVLDPIFDAEMRSEVEALRKELNDIITRIAATVDEKDKEMILAHLESLNEHAILLLEEPCSAVLRSSLHVFLDDVQSTIEKLRAES